LLQHDKVVDVLEQGWERSAFIASFAGRADIVSVLLQHDTVDVTIQNNEGKTALHLAAENGHVEVVKALLTNDKVDVNLHVCPRYNRPLAGESKWTCGSRRRRCSRTNGGCQFSK
jgi:hypothetical protein